MVISDYGRAKSLFAGTDIKIFKRGVVLLLLLILCIVAIVSIIMKQHVYRVFFFLLKFMYSDLTLNTFSFSNVQCCKKLKQK